MEINGTFWPPHFVGRTVIITGAAAGIGAEVARRLAGPGVTLFLVDRDLERTEGLAAELMAAGATITVASANLRDALAAEEFTRTLPLPPQPVSLINCASGMSRKTLMDVEPEEWATHYEVNVVAAAYLVRGLVPHFKEYGGSVVNVSSEAAYRARASAIAYDTAKAALLGLGRVLAKSLAEYGVRVNTVAPGWTITERHLGYDADPQARAAMESTKTEAVMGRPGRPHEIAGPICFLASEEASYIDATVLHVDGGLSIH